MKSAVVEHTVPVSVPAEELFRWHERPGALERLSPPWQRVDVRRRARLEAGERAQLELRWGPLKKEWVARVESARAPEGFTDIQETGPFGAWRHEHLMEEREGGGSCLRERVTYRLPGWLSRCGLARREADRQIRRFLLFRANRLRADMERSLRWGDLRGKRVLISGRSGLIGRRLGVYLQTLGCEVAGLSRKRDGDGWIRWDPERKELKPAVLEGWDAIIHLAGEPIAGGRWTTKRRRRIRDSRVQSTRLLVERLQNVQKKPEVFLCASGVNFYEQGGSEHTETSPAGSGFLAEVCQEWEAEARKVEQLGIRAVQVRTGVVLDPGGGALGAMLPVFRAGLGGPVGNGRQGFPWIGMDDLLDIYVRAWTEGGLRGPINAVAPEAVDNGGFSRMLGRVLRRPSVLPFPAGLIQLALGDLGRETLLGDLHIRPAALEAHGHPFRHARLEDCLRFLLGRQQPGGQGA